MTIVKSLASYESANFNAFKKPTELVVQANPRMPKIAAIPHKNLSIWKRSVRPTSAASANTKLMIIYFIIL